MPKKKEIRTTIRVIIRIKKEDERMKILVSLHLFSPFSYAKSEAMFMNYQNFSGMITLINKLFPRVTYIAFFDLFVSLLTIFC